MSHEVDPVLLRVTHAAPGWRVALVDDGGVFEEPVAAWGLFEYPASALPTLAGSRHVAPLIAGEFGMLEPVDGYSRIVGPGQSARPDGEGGILVVSDRDEMPESSAGGAGS